MAFDATTDYDTFSPADLKTKTVTLPDGRVVRNVPVEPYKLNGEQRPVLAWKKEKPETTELVIDMRPWAKSVGVHQGSFSAIASGIVSNTHANGYAGVFVTDDQASLLNIIRLPEGHFKCHRCKEHLPVNQASRSKTKPSGIASVCLACAKERASSPEGRASLFLMDTARRIRSNLGLSGSPSALAKELFDADINKGSRLHTEFTKIILEADRLYGRDERGYALYQLDHGVPVAVAPHLAFLSNNVRPLPLNKHKRKTKHDIKNISSCRDTEQSRDATEKVFKMVKAYCLAVPFLDWDPTIFGLAEEWSDMESLIADMEALAPETKAAKVPPLPTTEEIMMANGIIRDTEVLSAGVYPDGSPMQYQNGLNRPYVSVKERKNSRMARAAGAKFWAKSPARVKYVHYADPL